MSTSSGPNSTASPDLWAGQEGSKKRKRVSRACDACFAKKDRCDGAHPVCKVCRDLDRRCTYDRPERKRGPLQGVRQRLEAQIEILESVLGYMVDTFPKLSHEAVRALMLDDGQTFVAQTHDTEHAHKDGKGTPSGAGPSRLPSGNVYPHYSKAHAKEIWRHSDLAKSIAPSLGLRLGLQDEEEDNMDQYGHQQRVEEARRARSRLMAIPMHRTHPHAPPSLSPSMAGNHVAQLGNLSAYPMHPPPLQAPLSEPLHSHPPMHHGSSNPGDTQVGPSMGRMMPPAEVNFDGDPFAAAQWTHGTLDLGNVGEGAHALAYALGLPAAEGPGSNNNNSAVQSSIPALSGVHSSSTTISSTSGPPYPHSYAYASAINTPNRQPLAYATSSVGHHQPSLVSAGVPSDAGQPRRPTPRTNVRQHGHGYGTGLMTDLDSHFPSDQASNILYQLGLQDHM